MICQKKLLITLIVATSLIVTIAIPLNGSEKKKDPVSGNANHAEVLVSPKPMVCWQTYAVESEKIFEDVISRSNINEKDLRGVTALHVAIAKGFDKSTRSLLDRKANPNILSSYGRTPLVLALEQGYRTFIQPLLAHNADPNLWCKEKTALSPLMWASHKGDLEIMRALLDAKANVNDYSDKGHTPLHCVDNDPNGHCMKLLLEAKAQVEPKDKYDLTPLDYSVCIAHIKILLAAGAIITHKTLQKSQERVDKASRENKPRQAMIHTFLKGKYQEQNLKHKQS